MNIIGTILLIFGTSSSWQVKGDTRLEVKIEMTAFLSMIFTSKSGVIFKPEQLRNGS